MHWSNGKIHEDLTVGGKVYITDHKHIAIFGTKDYTGYGEYDVHSYIYGKDVGISANNKYYSDSNNGSNLWSKQYIHIEAGSGTANHSSTSGNGIEIVSKNGEALLSSEGSSSTIKSTEYVNLIGSKGITVNNISYGTSLPTSNNTEGKIFFKLIS